MERCNLLSEDEEMLDEEEVAVKHRLLADDSLGGGEERGNAHTECLLR